MNLPYELRNISFCNYINLKINKIICIFICKCCFKCSELFKNNRIKNNVIINIEEFINSTYNADKYQEIYETTVLIREILLEKEQKEAFKKMDYEKKYMLYYQ